MMVFSLVALARIGSDTCPKQGFLPVPIRYHHHPDL